MGTKLQSKSVICVTASINDKHYSEGLDLTVYSSTTSQNMTMNEDSAHGKYL